jgi:hypothetical protein
VPKGRKRAQKGAKGAHACPFLGDSYYRKKAFGILGTVFGGFARGHVPFWGILIIRKKLLAF